MKEQLLARIENQRLCEEVSKPYRNRYFSTECTFDSRQWTIETLATETVERVEFTDEDEVFVITRSLFKLPGYPQKVMRHRYQLQPTEMSWIISHVDLGCMHCEGRGDASCALCNGDPWQRRKGLDRG
jgi:hypothetical protein